MKLLLIPFLLLIPSVASASKNEIERAKKEVRKMLEASGARPTPPPYQVVDTPSGYRFLYTLPGPCSCIMEDRLICSERFEEETAAFKYFKQAPPTGSPDLCPPDAGCTPGGRTVYIQCKRAEGATGKRAKKR